MLIVSDFNNTCTVIDLHRHLFLNEQMQKLEANQTYYAIY
jgi:hypothetical protein